ncbi:hypothetical protein ACZ91_35365 [Streptomyces regensis]|nr:hypothetical protein ACZ91_35365 [Streptomyces regensis]
MRYTGGEVERSPVSAGGDTSTQRVLLTIAVRDYPDDAQAEVFAEGIDQQLDAVSEWWRTPGPLSAFRQVAPPELRTRDDVEDFLREHNVREMSGHALVLFVTGHGIKPSADSHFLRLPDSVKERPLATAMRTADIVAAALDSHVDNVLVIVNTCFAGNMNTEIAALEKMIRPSRSSGCKLDVLVTCGHNKKIQVLKFPTLLRQAMERLRRTAGITAPLLSVPEFMAEYTRGLNEAEESTFGLRRLLAGSGFQRTPCLPNPGYVHVREVLGSALQHGPLVAEYWLDRATGRPQEHDQGWYFRGRIELNRVVASFLGPDAPRGVLLITGCAGSGKSAVLARAVTLADPAFRREPLYKTVQDLADADTIPAERSVTAAVLTRHLDAAQVAEGVLHALGVRPEVVQSTGDRVEVWSQQIQEHVRTCGRMVTIVLDGLDEAKEQARIVGDILTPLAPLCHPVLPGPRRDQPGDEVPAGLRLLIGVRSSRPADNGHDASYGQEFGLLGALRETFPAARVERTDGPHCKKDIEEYLHALIGDAIDTEARDDIVAGVADVVWPSFIDARLAGDQLRRAEDPLALARSEDWHTRLRGGIRGLLQRDLQLVGREGLPADAALALLKAAAYAKGQGVPWGEVWPAIAGVFLSPRRLGDEEWDAMIEKLLASPLSGYLAHAVEDDRRVYRPAHEELVDVLLDPDAKLFEAGGQDV